MHELSSSTCASMYTPNAQPPEWKSTTVLPYVRARGISEPLRHTLAPLKVRVYVPDIEKSLVRLKNTISDLQKSSVV